MVYVVIGDVRCKRTLRHSDYDPLVHTVLSVHINVACACFLCFDHALSCHGCNLRITALILDILVPGDRLIFDDLLRLDRKGLSFRQRNRRFVDLHCFCVAIFAAGRCRMHYLRFCQPYLLAVF